MSLTEMPGSPTPPVVLHVLPYDLARGAQRYARALVDALNTEDESHQILTLFRADPVLLRPDVELDVPRGMLRRLGLTFKKSRPGPPSGTARTSNRPGGRGPGSSAGPG